MPHLTLTVSPGGPLLDIHVGVSQARRNALVAANQTVPPSIPTRALVDTGASCTCVDPTILNQLGITPTGTAHVHTPTTGAAPATASQFDVSIVIIFGTPPRLLYGNHTIAVVESDLTAQGIEALIGRDILETGMLQYNGETGLFSLAF